jgi:hypothetical protein
MHGSMSVKLIRVLAQADVPLFLDDSTGDRHFFLIEIFTLLYLKILVQFRFSVIFIHNK